MFNKIETAIIRVLQENLKDVPKENIGMRAPDVQAGKNLPAISLTNVDFEIDEVGIGRVIGEEDMEFQETFSGDGKKIEIPFAGKPPEQLIAVEHPPGRKLEVDNDFTVDYDKGMINFHSRTHKGKNNIVVRFLKSTQIKGLTFNLRYQLNVWATDEKQRDSIAIKVVEILLREEESLNYQGLFIKPLRGFTIPQDKEAPETVYGKTIEYLVKADLQVKTPISRIETQKIDVQRV